MNIGKIFGATFFSVVAALAVYDLVVKGMLSKFGVSAYDDTFNPDGKNTSEYFIQDGKVYRVKKSA